MPAADALIVVDMLATYDHEDGDKLAASVEEHLDTMRGLVDQARAAGVPVIYVNDSFDDWKADRKGFIEELRSGERGDLIEPIVPDDEALFISKARHSIFFQTPLEHLLRTEEIERLCLIGQVTEQCILYSALDAHIRHFPVVVPRDAVACIHEDLAEAALRMMELNMEAAVCAASDVEFTS